VCEYNVNLTGKNEKVVFSEIGNFSRFCNISYFVGNYIDVGCENLSLTLREEHRLESV
jgi:hypothetical protein